MAAIHSNDDEAPSFFENLLLRDRGMRTEVYDETSPTLSERLRRVMFWMDEITKACSSGIELFVMSIADELLVNPVLQQQVLDKLARQAT